MTTESHSLAGSQSERTKPPLDPNLLFYFKNGEDQTPTFTSTVREAAKSWLAAASDDS